MAKESNGLILTFGYGNRTGYQELEAAVSKYNISYIVDVRKNPRGWSPLWGASGLRNFCESIGIKYLSKTELGNTSGTSNWVPLNPDMAATALEDVSALSMAHNILLLCAEKDWNRCHRTEVSECVKEKTGNAVVHLG